MKLGNSTYIKKASAFLEAKKIDSPETGRIVLMAAFLERKRIVLTWVVPFKE